MLMKRYSIFLLLFLTGGAINVCAGEYDDLLKTNHFVEYPVPIYGSDEWTDANRDDNTFFVGIRDGEVSISTAVPYNENIIFDAGNIKYEGTNNGEWGGGLTAIYPDGTRQPLIAENIVSILPFNRAPATTTEESVAGKPGLYVFTGLAHLGSSSGAIYVIEDYETNPAARKITLLPDAPSAITIHKYNNEDVSIIIVGSSTVLTYVPEWDDLEVLLIDQFWWGMSPTSAVSKNYELLIGMRSGLISIDLNQPEITARYFRKSGPGNTLKGAPSNAVP